MAAGRHNGFLGFLGAIWWGINFVRQALLNVIFFGLLLLLIGVAMKTSHPSAELKSGTILVLHPEGRLVEQYSINPTQRAIAALAGEPAHQVQLRDLLTSIDAAADDSHIRAILLDPGDLQTGPLTFAALRQVGHALDQFRKTGKQVIAWSPSYTQSQYYLAVHANRVLMDPEGSALFTGLSSYQLYFKDLLDKLGVKVHLIRVGKFKSYAEPFILNGPSPAAQQENQSWMGDVWTQWLDSVAKARKLDPGQLTADIVQLPQQVAAANGDLAKMLLNEHLLDGLLTRAQLIAQLQKLGVPGRRGHGFRAIGFRSYLAKVKQAQRRHRSQKSEVAIIVAEGEIISGPQKPGTIGGVETARLIRKAREARQVKAIVLRVNSPGGSVFPAELIRREVQLTRAAGKPVVVSMGNVAASGGYWISMDANQIVAEPNTITGSIGIFGLFFNVPNMLAKIGVHSGGLGTTPWAGAMDVTRPMNPKFSAAIQLVINKGYRNFVGGVAKARHKSFAQIDAIAQGHVWTGRQALKLGLVDKLGGINTAIRLAATDAKLGKNYRVVYRSEPLSRMQRFIVGFSKNAMVGFAGAYGIRLPSWLADLAPRVSNDLLLLQQARPGQVNAFAYCFCGQ